MVITKRGEPVGGVCRIKHTGSFDHLHPLIVGVGEFIRCNGILCHISKVEETKEGWRYHFTAGTYFPSGKKYG